MVNNKQSIKERVVRHTKCCNDSKRSVTRVNLTFLGVLNYLIFANIAKVRKTSGEVQSGFNLANSLESLEGSAGNLVLLSKYVQVFPAHWSEDQQIALHVLQ